MSTPTPADEPRPERVLLGDLCGTVDDSDQPMCMSCDLATDRLRGGLPNLDHVRCVSTWMADARPSEILRAAAIRMREYSGPAAGPIADWLDAAAEEAETIGTDPYALMAAQAILGVPAPQDGPVAPSAPRSTPDGVSDPGPCHEPSDGRTACAHCGREIENRATPHMGGPGRDHWVHIDGVCELCFPQRANSPRAEPKETRP